MEYRPLVGAQHCCALTMYCIQTRTAIESLRHIWGLGTKFFVKAPCPITLNPLQWICDVSLEIDIPAEWLRRSFHCL
ncbi:hypothetical protein [Nostoc sp.]